MKTYTIRPLVWTKHKERYKSEGISGTYLIYPEHSKYRLYYSPSNDERAELFDYISYNEAMVQAQEHHDRKALKFLKEVL